MSVAQIEELTLASPIESDRRDSKAQNIAKW